MIFVLYFIYHRVPVKSAFEPLPRCCCGGFPPLHEHTRVHTYKARQALSCLSCLSLPRTSRPHLRSHLLSLTHTSVTRQCSRWSSSSSFKSTMVTAAESGESPARARACCVPTSTLTMRCRYRRPCRHPCAPSVCAPVHRDHLASVRSTLLPLVRRSI